MRFLSEKLNKINPSATLTISQKARQLQREGYDVLSLSAGEPDFPTPDSVIAAGKAAMDEGFTKYTAVGGTLELKKAIIEKFKRENNLEYELDQIIVSAGAKQVLYNALLATLDPGDEVIIPAPYWVSYVDIVRIAGGTPILIECPEIQGFKLTPEQLAQNITEKTKWLILNSPSNPCGAVYAEDELKDLAKVLLNSPSVHVITDDIYEHILYTGLPFKTVAQVEPALKDRTLTVNGVSKAYSMTGWRVGYGGGASELIAAMIKIQSQSTSNPCSISQKASIAALEGSQDFLAERAAEFKKRREYVVGRLNGIQGLSCLMPAGSFYAYPSCAGVVGKTTPEGKVIAHDEDFSSYLIDHGKVAVVPGAAFGLSPYFRVSYATDMETLEKALDRIEQAIALLT